MVVVSGSNGGDPTPFPLGDRRSMELGGGDRTLLDGVWPPRLWLLVAGPDSQQRRKSVSRPRPEW